MSAGVETVAEEQQGPCFFCTAVTDDVETRPCTFARGACGGRVRTCAACAFLHDEVVCATCYERVWRTRCFSCKRAGGLQVKRWGRYCESCYIVWIGESRWGPCFYCNTAGDVVETRECTWSGGSCGGRVRVCDGCSLLHGQVVCEACYRRGWCNTCFACKTLMQADGQQCGRYCEDCNGVRVGNGRCYCC